MSESRQELLAWVNDLLHLNYSKIEQLGTGAAYCQIVDSVYGDVPLPRVKFNAKQDYEYLHNFKILQNSFTKHKLDKAIPVDSLIKCRFADNFSFLQWLKRFHDTNASSEYDPLSRRKDGPPASTATRTAGVRSGTPSRRSTTPSERSASRTGKVGVARPGSATSRAAPSADQSAKIEELQRVNVEQQAQIETVERERDFYYEKLRAIEDLMNTIDTNEKIATLLRGLHSVMYGTEEGFVQQEEQIDPDQSLVADDLLMEQNIQNIQDIRLQDIDEDETF
ncbi:microtubule integrity protein mal3 [Basidiobolus ranarum]|uniref:Microtubule integrity protein mal3 n=1 Tax=Basidiobolus ranarum TaxID=34480 RepID=A0ABR2WIA9_9FUNG